MTSRQTREDLRRQRSDLRRSLALSRQRAQEQLRRLRARIPSSDPDRLRRRLRRWLGVAMVLLLLYLLTLLRCDSAPVPVPAPDAAAPPAGKPRVKVTSPGRPPLAAPTGRTAFQPRPTYAPEAQKAASWIDDFRSQVAARGARLSACFAGADRPGSLRWTASVNPESGAVSDHELEPVGAGVDIRLEQRACLTSALASPPYRLAAAAAPSVPTRIGLVIEF